MSLAKEKSVRLAKGKQPIELSNAHHHDIMLCVGVDGSLNDRFFRLLVVQVIPY